MNKNISTKLFTNFLLCSIIAIVLGFLYYLFFTKTDNSILNFYYVNEAFLNSLLLYAQFIIFVLSISVYLSFSNYTFTAKDGFFSNITKPIVMMIILTVFCAVFDNILSSKILATLESKEQIAHYLKYIEYENDLKNKAYYDAQQALANGNIKLAYEYASDALYYAPNEVNTLVLLKNIREASVQRKEKNESEKIQIINNYLSLGTRYFSQSNYTEALKYFNQILDLEKYHTLALYYVNKIKSMNQNGYLYGTDTTEGVASYDRLSQTINMYNSKNYWGAYSNIVNLYKEYPFQSEVKNYYSIIVSELRKNDFFIEDADMIKSIYIQDTISALDIHADDVKNGFHIMLNKDTMLYTSASVFFRNEFFLFNTYIIKFDKNFENLEYTVYAYGKLLSESPDGKRTLVLKGLYNPKTGVYDNNNLNSSRFIELSISDSSLYALKNISNLKLKYRNIVELFKWKKEISKYGYSVKELNYYMIGKILDPIHYLLLIIIIMYYLIRFKVREAKELHFYHSFIGFIGTILVTFLYKSVFDFLTNSISLLIPFKFSVTLMFIPVIVLLLFYIFQISRINTNA